MDKSEDRNRDMKKFFDEKLKTNNYQRVAGLDGKKIFASKLEGTFFEFPKTLLGRSIIDELAAEYGCTYSHLKAIQTFVTDKSNSDDLAIICEDDIDIFDGVTQSYVLQYIQQTPENWEILKIQLTNPGHIKHACIFPWKIGFFGTCAYIIKRSVAQSFVDKFFINNRVKFPPLHGPADWFIYNNARTYCCFPGIFYQKPSVKSTIHKKNDNGDAVSKKWYPPALHIQQEIWKKINRRPPRRRHNVRRKINKRFLPILY